MEEGPARRATLQTARVAVVAGSVEHTRPPPQVQGAPPLGSTHPRLQQLCDTHGTFLSHPHSRAIQHSDGFNNTKWHLHSGSISSKIDVCFVIERRVRHRECTRYSCEQAPLLEMSLNGRDSEISDYLGHKVYCLLPQGGTSVVAAGCALRDAYPRLRQDAVVIGISPDEPPELVAFREKYNLPFVCSRTRPRGGRSLRRVGREAVVRQDL